MSDHEKDFNSDSQQDFNTEEKLPPINPVQPHNYNVMPDGMLEAISATDMVLLALAKDAPKIPPEDQEADQESLKNLGDFENITPPSDHELL